MAIADALQLEAARRCVSRSHRPGFSLRGGGGHFVTSKVVDILVIVLNIQPIFLINEFHNPCHLSPSKKIIKMWFFGSGRCRQNFRCWGGRGCTLLPQKLMTFLVIVLNIQHILLINQFHNHCHPPPPQKILKMWLFGSGGATPGRAGRSTALAPPRQLLYFASLIVWIMWTENKNIYHICPLTVSFVLFWQWNNLSGVGGRQLFSRKSASGWPGSRMFWPPSVLD